MLNVFNPDVSLRWLLKRFMPLLNQVGLISLLIGGMALIPTVYNMALYDTVIPSSSTKSLGGLLLGVMLSLVAETVLRMIRNRRLGYFAARLDHFVSMSVFERLLFLSPVYTERASASAQLARLRDFDSVREFFTGPLATLFFELPLILVYTAAMFFIAGPLALVPVALVGAYGLLIGLMNAPIKEAAKAAARASSQKQEFLLETLSKLRALRLAGFEEVWQERWRKLSTMAARASFQASYRAQILETGSYVLMSLGAVVTLTWGVLMAIDQTLTTGALIAGMMLVWRIVAPMQMCCASITRLQQLKASTGQVQRLLALPPEQAMSDSVLNLKGQVTFHRISLRYAQDAEPALMGVSFDIKPGQIIAIKGDNGSGKSSILKLILGLYQPQGGALRLDGIDLRQFDPLVVRQSITYVPQDMEVLPGTIRDNLLYAAPYADENACLDALRKACALEEVERLPGGLDTIIAGEDAEAISFMLKQRLNLARAYLKPAKLMLFDEASHSLGLDNDQAFAALIDSLRGKCTVILATHREDHMRLADVLLVMNKGELTHMGPPEQVLKAVNGNSHLKIEGKRK